MRLKPVESGMCPPVHRHRTEVILEAERVVELVRAGATMGE